MNSYGWLVFGMFLVTFIPRLLPMVVTRNLPFPPFVQRWLSFVPYAALGALIFPGILSVDEHYWWVGAIGGIAAILLAYVQRNVIIVVVGAIITVMGLQAMI